MSLFAPNVGRLDAAIRSLLAIAILAGGIWWMRSWDADWALTLLVHPAILATYLLLTAVARNDIAYHAFGWSTLRHRDRGAGRERTRDAPPRQGRPL